MGASIWQVIPLALVVVFVAVAIWLPVRILHRAGYSGWWVLLNFVPLVNIVMIRVFSFQSWPSGQSRMTTHDAGPPPGAAPPPGGAA